MKVPPSASSAMVRPPEAEPVERCQHVGGDRERHQRPAADAQHPVAHHAKAGMAATTAPKPTRLATDMTGSTEALAPASMVR